MESCFIFSNFCSPVWDLLFKFNQKCIHLFWSGCSLVLFKLGYQIEYPWLTWGCIIALHKRLGRLGTNISISYKKMWVYYCFFWLPAKPATLLIGIDLVSQYFFYWNSLFAGLNSQCEDGVVRKRGTKSQSIHKICLKRTYS